jgi:A/G-specific adenine glycosylase
MTETEFHRWLSGSRLSGFRRRLLSWFEIHGRDLKWRQTRDAYRIWISEIMLQQTTVVAVVPYYEKFLNRFPTIRILAVASEEEVLRFWEGLGYYSRARNIHKTAKIISEEHNGRFPETVAEILKLPGIGRYTAGAIVSFAFDRPAPIVEANTLRLYCRLMGFSGNPRSTAGGKLLWDLAERLVSPKCPGQMNQALMELGAMVCRPGSPDCPQCPVKSCCRAFLENTTDKIPAPKPRPKITPVTAACIAVEKQGQFLIRRYRDNERWAGLWDFPRLEIPEYSGKEFSVSDESSLSSQIEHLCNETFGIEIQLSELRTEIRHSVTRYRIRLLCYHGMFHSGEPQTDHEYRWISPEKLTEFPLSVTGRKFAKLLLESK